MSLGVNRKEYFQRLIYLVPVVQEDSVMKKLVEEAKGKLAEALVQYVHQGTRLNETYLLKDTRGIITIKIKPDKVGACVVQTADPDIKITKIDFRKLSLPYLSNSCDFDLVESAVSIEKIVYCRKGLYHKYRDNILIVPLTSKFLPFLEMAKNIIADAAVHFSKTNENIIEDRSFLLPSKKSFKYSLNLRKINFGVCVEQIERDNFMDRSTDSIEIDFRHLIKLRSFLEKILPGEENQIREQVGISLLWSKDSVLKKANEYIIQSAYRYYHSKEQIINRKVEILGQTENSKKKYFVKLEIIGEEDELTVIQLVNIICNGKTEKKDFKTDSVDFNTLKLEDN